jgi:peptidoglycan/xylan/chitin deacetylase (PgdA/CDA1 family)
MSKRIPLRRLYSSVIAHSGVAASQRWRTRRRATILTYHNIDSAAFAGHMQSLSRTYHIVSLAQAVAALQSKATLPANGLAITFDDGFAAFYSDVYPVLQHYQAPATVFLTTGYIGSHDVLWFSWIDLAIKTHADITDILPPSLRELEHWQLRRALMPYLKAAPDDERLRLVEQIKQRTTASPEEIARHRLLTWDQARTMQSSGLVAFGGHTRTHPILARASVAKAHDEIAGCAADLSRELGVAERHFAYPNGELTDFNQPVKEMVRQAGFTCAVTALRGTCAPGDDLYALRRVAIDGSFSVAEAATKLSGLWIHLGQGGV